MVQKTNKSILDSSSVVIAVNQAKVNLTFTFSVEDINKAYEAEFAKVSSQTKVKGFRKGKANKFIEQRNGPAIRAQTLDSLLDTQVKQLIGELKHDVATTPTVTKSDGDGQSAEMKIELSYEVFPEMPETDLSKISIKGVNYKVAKSDIDEEIDRIRDHHCDWKAAEGKSEEGHRISMDYAGKIGDELFEGGSATDQQMVLGEKRFMPEFEAALVGVEKGKEVTFDVNFPEDYHGKNVAGKTAQFAVKVHAVEAKAPKALGKELYELAGTQANTKPEFEKEIKERLEADAAYLVEAVNRRRLLKELSSVIKVDLPQGVVEKETKSAIEQEEGMAEKDAKQVVENNLMRALIVKHYMRQMDIKITTDDIKKHIEIMTPPQVSPEYFFQWYVQDKDRVQQAQSTLLEQKTLSEVLTKVKMETKAHSLSEIEAELKESA